MQVIHFYSAYSSEMWALNCASICVLNTHISVSCFGRVAVQVQWPRVLPHLEAVPAPQTSILKPAQLGLHTWLPLSFAVRVF